MNPDLLSVIDYNRRMLARARELNCRAGQQVFPVMDRGSLATWLANRLQGARRGSEVADPRTTIKLPELDEAEVARVLSECPDTLTVLGIELPVEYREGGAPRIQLTDELVSKHRWNDLPDSGIFTPGGLLVEVTVKLSYWTTMSETDISRLKVGLLEHCNHELWNRWSRPTIDLPDPTHESGVVPEIREETYGRCVVTGRELKAYGTVVYNTSRWYAHDPYFNSEWTRNRSEAERMRAEAVSKMAVLHQKVAEQKELERVKVESETLKKELWDLTHKKGWYDIDIGYRRRVEERRLAVVLSTLQEYRTWIGHVKALLVEVETAMSVFNQKSSKGDRRREAQGEASQSPALGSSLNLSDLTNKWPGKTAR